MKEIDEANFKNYKSNSENYSKLIKKLVRTLPSNILILELKRRKLIKFDWLKAKYVETDSERNGRKI